MDIRVLAAVVVVAVASLLLANWIAAWVARQKLQTLEAAYTRLLALRPLGAARDDARSASAAGASTRASPAPRQVPVTIVTGFLGAGKTVLLNRLLASPGAGRRICVIENEAGAVSIDHALLRSPPPAGTDAAAGGGVLVLKNGCVCCSASGTGDELARTLDRLLGLSAANDGGENDSADAAGSPAFDYVVIETSGLADPAPLVQTFFRSALAAARYRLDGVVAVVDAKHIGRHLDGAGLLSRAAEAGQQVAYADVVIVNKVDVATPQQLAQARSAVRAINPAAEIIECSFCEVDAAMLLDRGSFDVVRAAALLREQLAEGSDSSSGRGGDDGFGVGVAAVRARHRGGVAALTLGVPGSALPLARLLAWLRSVVAAHWRHLYRVKGLVFVVDEESEGGPVLFAVHGVHAELQGTRVDPDQAQKGLQHLRPALVLIGRGLDQAALEAEFRTDVLAFATPLLAEAGSCSCSDCSETGVLGHGHSHGERGNGPPCNRGSDKECNGRSGGGRAILRSRQRPRAASLPILLAQALAAFCSAPAASEPSASVGMTLVGVVKPRDLERRREDHRGSHAFSPEAGDGEDDVHVIWLQTGRRLLSALAPASSFSWPIVVPLSNSSCSRVTDVAVDLVGLQHPRAGDLEIVLRHGDRSAVLARGAGVGRRIAGALPARRHAEGGTAPRAAAPGYAPHNPRAPLLPEPPLWSFSDSSEERNLALGTTTFASSFMYSAPPALAVDGRLDGLFSDRGVFLSGPVAAESGRTAWLEIDLGAIQRVGAVRLFDRALEGFLPDVLEVRLAALGNVTGGGFRLGLTLPAAAEGQPLFVSTDFIGALASASEVQAALEALPLAGQVIVTLERLGADGTADGLSHWRWLCTFVDRAGLPDFSILGATIEPQHALANVSTSFSQRGLQHTWLDDAGRVARAFSTCSGPGQEAAEADEVPFGVPCGNALGCGASGFAPGHLILGSVALGDVSLDEALHANSTVFSTRLQCQRPRARDVLVPTAPPGGSSPVARFVRIQRADAELLWLAELQAFAAPPRTLGRYTRGATVLPDSFESENGLRAAFGDTPTAGPWLLEMRTRAAPRSAVPARVSDDLPASIATWVLELECDAGAGDDVAGGALPAQRRQRHQFEAQVYVRVHTYPRGGRLEPARWPSTFVDGGGSGGGGSGGGGGGGGGSLVVGAAPDALRLAPALVAVSVGPQADVAQCAPGQTTALTRDGRSQASCAPEGRLLHQGNDGAVAWLGDAAAFLASQDAAAARATLLRLDWRHSRHCVRFRRFAGFSGLDFFSFSAEPSAMGGLDGEPGGALAPLSIVQLSVGASAPASIGSIDDMSAVPETRDPFRFDLEA